MREVQWGGRSHTIQDWITLYHPLDAADFLDWVIAYVDHVERVANDYAYEDAQVAVKIFDENYAAMREQIERVEQLDLTPEETPKEWLHFGLYFSGMTRLIEGGSESFDNQISWVIDLPHRIADDLKRMLG